MNSEEDGARTDLSSPTTLGRTGLLVGRLGISSSFGAPASAFEEAFERGCNYFTWGSFIKGRSSEMKRAVHNIVQGGRRDQLVMAMYTYAHNTFLMERFLKKGLRAGKIEYADVLLLGYYNSRPSRRMIDRALELREQGLIRFLGISSHKRALFSTLQEQGLFDVFHLRYNAAHRGAESDVFPQLGRTNPPGIVTFTATRWRKLLKAKNTPKDDRPLSAVDCYRFVLSNPHVDVCMMGAKNSAQMHENLEVLRLGPLDASELERVRRIGDHVYGKPRNA